MEDRMLLFLGDIHLNRYAKQLLLKLHRSKVENADIFQVGDFGLGFQEEFLDRLMLTEINTHLKKTNCTLTIIRGNHDNPDLFNPPAFKFSNINIMPDNSIIKLCGKNILCVGGAISIDRMYRKEMIPKWGITCWPEKEEFVFDKEALDAMDLSEVDIICTHSSPRFTHPLNFSTIVYDFADQDPGLLRDLENERQLITEFYDYVKPKMPNLKNYFYGHFHSSWNSVIEDVEFRLLGIYELYELKID